VAKNGGKNHHRVFAKPSAPPTLAEAGIDKNLANRARVRPAGAPSDDLIVQYFM